MAEHVCPVWAGRLLANPLRKLINNPEKIFGDYVADGMNVLDIGCAMGFFSLPLAAMVGDAGKVICIDMQEKMIDSLKKRARKAGVLERIETHLCGQNSLALEEYNSSIDFALAFAVVHEVPDSEHFFSEIHDAVKPGGKFYVSEPKGHVSENDFSRTISLAEKKGFKQLKRSRSFFEHSAVLERV